MESPLFEMLCKFEDEVDGAHLDVEGGNVRALSSNFDNGALVGVTGGLTLATA
jgi:hypothetical protein